MSWISILLASLQILAKISPDVIAQFHGGAHNTATKVGAAFDIVNGVTSNLAAGLAPLEGIAAASLEHPAIIEKAAAIDATGETGQGATQA